MLGLLAVWLRAETERQDDAIRLHYFRVPKLWVSASILREYVLMLGNPNVSVLEPSKHL